jgi:phospholipid-translocating ATPase
MYRHLQKGRELSIKAFLYWMFKSIFQAALIMICSVLYFDKIYLKISTIAFTSLIIAELLNVYSEIKFLHPVMCFSLIITLFSYVGSLVFLKSILDVSYLDFNTIVNIVVMTVASWLPFYLYNKVRMCLWPEAHEKVNTLVNIKN